MKSKLISTKVDGMGGSPLLFFCNLGNANPRQPVSSPIPELKIQNSQAHIPKLGRKLICPRRLKFKA